MTAVVVAAAVLALLTTAGHALAGNREIVIGPGALEPRVLLAPLNERVTFVNRSGRMVHVELIGPEGAHHVFQVPGRIWAEFHRPGPHPYVVHFETGDPGELSGFVRIDGEPTPVVTPPECTGLTVQETCIER